MRKRTQSPQQHRVGGRSRLLDAVGKHLRMRLHGAGLTNKQIKERARLAKEKGVRLHEIPIQIIAGRHTQKPPEFYLGSKVRKIKSQKPKKKAAQRQEKAPPQAKPAVKEEPPAEARAEIKKALFVPPTPLQEGPVRTHILGLWAGRIRKGVARGKYDAFRPPPAEALMIVAELSKFDVQKILKILGIDYSMWHTWLDKQKLLQWFDRELRLSKRK